MGTKLRVVALALTFAAGLLGSAGPASSQEPSPSPSPSSSSSSDETGLARIGIASDASILSAMRYTFFIGEDPALMGGRTRHDPWKHTFNGSVETTNKSQTDFISAMIWGGYEVTDHLDLGPNQRLVVGGFYQYNHAWTNFNGDAEQNTSLNSFGLIVVYVRDSWHVSGAASFGWGHGRLTSLPSGNQGSFDTSAYSFGIQAGRVITLLGDGYATTRPGPASWPFGVQQISVYLDPAFRFGYSRIRAGAFVNDGGTPFGKEVERTWSVGGSVVLSAVIPQSDGVLWRPYIEFSLDHQVGYDHTLDIPNGPVSTLDHHKTYYGVSGGVGVWLNRNVSLGLSGFYRGSGSQDSGGGLFWFRVNLFGPGGYLRSTLSR